MAEMCACLRQEVGIGVTDDFKRIRWFNSLSSPKLTGGGLGWKSSAAQGLKSHFN